MAMMNRKQAAKFVYNNLYTRWDSVRVSDLTVGDIVVLDGKPCYLGAIYSDASCRDGGLKLSVVVYPNNSKTPPESFVRRIHHTTTVFVLRYWVRQPDFPNTVADLDVSEHLLDPDEVRDHIYGVLNTHRIVMDELPSSEEIQTT